MLFLINSLSCLGAPSGGQKLHNSASGAIYVYEAHLSPSSAMGTFFCVLFWNSERYDIQKATPYLTMSAAATGREKKGKSLLFPAPNRPSARHSPLRDSDPHFLGLPMHHHRTCRNQLCAAERPYIPSQFWCALCEENFPTFTSPSH